MSARLTPWIAPVFVAALLVGVALSGRRLHTVRVTLLAGHEEPTDPTLLGIGDDHAAPDYHLELLVGESWLDCGLFRDTPVGAGLEFQVPASIAPGEVSALRLIEQDKLDDDVLEELELPAAARAAGGPLEGEAFGFELRVGFSVGQGLDRFVATPLGLLVLLAALGSISALALGRLLVDRS